MSLRKFAAQLLGRGVELKAAVAAGAAANTDIAVPGLGRRDVLVAVLELQPPTALSGNAIVANRVDQTAIVADGTIRISANTTGNQLLVLYWSV